MEELKRHSPLPEPSLRICSQWALGVDCGFKQTGQLKMNRLGDEQIDDAIDETDTELLGTLGVRRFIRRNTSSSIEITRPWDSSTFFNRMFINRNLL